MIKNKGILCSYFFWKNADNLSRICLSLSLSGYFISHFFERKQILMLDKRDSNIKKLTPILLSIIVMLFICNVIKANCASGGGKDYFNAVEIQINGQVDPEIKSGEDHWYYFIAPGNTIDEWVILRVVGLHERGTITVEVYDEYMNMVKSSYTLSGSHTGEIIFRMEDTIEGTKDIFIPRLLKGSKYYVRLYGTGKYSINLTTNADDYSGEYSLATALSVGNTTTGLLQRDDDIDAFMFVVPSGYAYNISVYATKKMNVKISDADNYTLDTNALRVMRDYSTSQYTVSGYGEVRYFFLYGLGGTKYTINVSIAPASTDETIGNWTKINAKAGNKYIEVSTLKGSTVTIIVKKAKSSKNLKLRVNKKKKYSAKQKKSTKRYYLNRRLVAGDVITISIQKKRYKVFHFKKKIS